MIVVNGFLILRICGQLKPKITHQISQSKIATPLIMGVVTSMSALTSDRVRLKRAGVPAEYQTARTKPEIALAEIDRMMAAGLRFGCVLADAGYGLSAPFHQALTARALAWAGGIPRHLKVYLVGVKLIWPMSAMPRRHCDFLRE